MSDDCAGEIGSAKQACEAGTAAGTAIGVGIIVVFWFFVDAILGMIWFVTRPKGRPCPVGGTLVKEGVTLCPKCGHDFRAAASGISPAPHGIPPPPP